MAFHDTRLPENIERGAKGGPEWNTTVIEMISGREQRNVEWALPRSSWDVGYSVLDQNDYQTVLRFFYARRGMAHAFRFKDWTDYSVAGQQIGVGDGINADFQVVKIYADTVLPFTRTITKLVAGSLVVYDNAGVVPSGDYTVSATGLITFDTPPVAAHVISVDFEFDVPVRFDVDKIDLVIDWVELADITGLRIREIRE